MAEIKLLALENRNSLIALRKMNESAGNAIASRIVLSMVGYARTSE